MRKCSRTLVAHPHFKINSTLAWEGTLTKNWQKLTTPSLASPRHLPCRSAHVLGFQCHVWWWSPTSQRGPHQEGRFPHAQSDESAQVENGLRIDLPVLGSPELGDGLQGHHKPWTLLTLPTLPTLPEQNQKWKCPAHHVILLDLALQELPAVFGQPFGPPAVLPLRELGLQLQMTSIDPRPRHFHQSGCCATTTSRCLRSLAERQTAARACGTAEWSLAKPRAKSWETKKVGSAMMALRDSSCLPHRTTSRNPTVQGQYLEVCRLYSGHVCATYFSRPHLLIWLAQINAYHATLCLLLVCPRNIILFNTWKLVSTSKHQILLHGSLSNRACEKMLKMLKDVKSLFESVVFSAFLLRANHVGGLQNLPFDPVDPPWFPARQGLAGALSFRWFVLPKAAAQHTASYQECKKHSDAWSWEVGNNPLSSEAWTWSVIMIIFGLRGKHAMGPQFVNECIAFALLCRSADCDVLWICLDTAYKAYIQPILWAGSGFGTLSPWLQLGWPRGVHLGASTWMWTWKPVILLKSGAKHFPEVKATNRWDTHLFVRKTFQIAVPVPHFHPVPMR